MVLVSGLGVVCFVVELVINLDLGAWTLEVHG
jgi:hypothetical protein